MTRVASVRPRDASAGLLQTVGGRPISWTGPLLALPRRSAWRAARLADRVAAKSRCRSREGDNRLALTQDLSGETSRLLDDIWDWQCLLTSGALIGNAMCIEKVCSGRCLDRKIHILRQVPEHRIQLAHDNTNQIPARVENGAAAVSQLHRGGDLDLMRIVKRAGQSGYDPGGYVPSGCQKLRERKSEHDRALASARGTPYSESGSGLGTPLELQQCQIVILVNRDDLCDAGLPATAFDRDNCATADNMCVREQVPGLGDEKTRSSGLCLQALCFAAPPGSLRAAQS